MYIPDMCDLVRICIVFRVYWTDKGRGTVECVDVNGGNRNIFASLSLALPFDIVTWQVNF